MRGTSAATCLAVGARRRRASDRAAVQCAAHAALTLPRLLPEAQRRYVQCDKGPMLARLALALLDEGMLDDARSNGSVDALVVEGIKRWLAPLIGGLQWFDLGCSIHENVCDVIGLTRQDVSSFAQDDAAGRAIKTEVGVHPDEDHLGLAFYARGRQEVVVGKGVQRLNAAASGLGWACLDAVESVGIHYDMLTFSWAEMAVQQVYWYGGDSEREWASESECDLSEFSGVTRAEFDRAVPAEIRAVRKQPTMQQIDAWCQSGDCAVVAAATKLLALRKLGKPQPLWSMPTLCGMFEWFETLDHTVWMVWDDAETLHRIADDYFESGMYGDQPLRPCVGITGIPLGERGWFRKTQRRWAKAAMQLRLADELLSVLHTKERK
jgi:hypothetical protein